MAWMHPDAIEERRQRWTRPDAERWLKPNPEHWLSPEELKLEHPELYERKYGAAKKSAAFEHDVVNPLDDPEVRLLLAEIKLDLVRLQYWRKAYNPNQPRVPAGNPDGGQWTGEGDGLGRIRLAELRTTVTDVDGRPYYRPGGHHEVPRGVYDKWNLRPETRRVFEEASTGRIGATIRSDPNAPPQGNIWDKAHRVYNDTVQQLGDKFLRDHQLKRDASDMTPDHASGSNLTVGAHV